MYKFYVTFNYDKSGGITVDADQHWDAAEKVANGRAFLPRADDGDLIYVTSLHEGNANIFERPESEWMTFICKSCIEISIYNDYEE
jgi:hypothetical protein